MTVSVVNFQGKYSCGRDSYIRTYITGLFSWTLQSKYEIHLQNIFFSGLKNYVLVYNCLNAHVIYITTDFSSFFKQDSQPHLFCVS